MNTDGEFAATILTPLEHMSIPYCDSMFIDNECRNYLTENPASKIIEDYSTRIFCQNNIEDFFNYLDSLKTNISEEHMKKVEEVYGAQWANPYSTIFN